MAGVHGAMLGVVEPEPGLEGLEGVTSAEVTGGEGNFIISINATEGYDLQLANANLNGDGELVYLLDPIA